MAKNIFWTGMLIVFALTLPVYAYTQEDMIVRAAIDTFKSQVHLPQGTEIKFSEKRRVLFRIFTLSNSLSSFLTKRCQQLSM